MRGLREASGLSLLPIFTDSLDLALFKKSYFLPTSPPDLLLFFESKCPTSTTARHQHPTWPQPLARFVIKQPNVYVGFIYNLDISFCQKKTTLCR